MKKKAVLITGASGFIGSHLTRRLLEKGAEVHVFLKDDSNQFRIQDLTSDITIWYGDLRNYESIYTCLKNSRPKIVFHLAASLDVRRDPELLEPMVDINIKGTLNFLRGIMSEKIPIECFINTGTSEEYGDGIVPFNEEQREMPVSPYSAGKVATTYFCQMLHKSMDVPTVTLRPFLTYGPNQNTNMFIPSLIQHCLEGKDFPMTIGDQTREFNYVDDIVEAYILTAQRKQVLGKVINIGNGKEYRIRDVAEKIVSMTGNSVKLLVGALQKRVGETQHCFCDNRKARNILGWAPKTDLDEGLSKTIDWYRKISPKNT